MEMIEMTTRVQYPKPLKKGDIAEKAFKGPMPVNWPMYSSRQKIGSPIKINMRKNGMRNAPVTKEQTLMLRLSNEHIHTLVRTWFCGTNLNLESTS